MNQSYFWLISIEEGTVVVSLVSLKEDRYSIAAIGGQVEWNSQEENSLAAAVDGSLSQAALKADLPESQEPENAAFILPPFWVGSDGKIIPDKKKTIEPLCRTLNLKPMGFIANDEAIVEEANLKDGFPASFVLLNLSSHSITISLVYLGKIKERIKKPMTNEFSPSLVESALIELNTESTLPPQILVFGQISDDIVSSLKNYPWIGKKDTETFLHFPDINVITPETLAKTFSSVIAAQVNLDSLKPSTQTKENGLDSQYETEIETETGSETDLEPEASLEKSQNEDNQTLENEKIETITADEDITVSDIKEVSPEDLGFSSSQPIPTNTPLEETLPLITPEDNLPADIPLQDLPIPSRKKSKLSLPKVSLSGLRIPLFVKTKGFLLIPAAFPLLLLLPFFFSKAQVRLFVTPYEYNYSAPVTVDTAAQTTDVNKKIIPAELKTLNFTASDSIPTTGEKTVGEKAQGEIVIFNKQDKAQSLVQGATLTDSSGHAFELVNPVSVTASDSDLDEGVINLGQTKALLIAKDIGPEYNIAKDTKLTFKDYPESSLVAKVNEAFAGGSKRQIKAVSKEDKLSLENRLDSSLKEELERKVEQDLSSLSGVIRDSIQTKKSRVEFNREEGEEAEELSASINATVNVLVVTPTLKKEIIASYLSGQENFDKVEIDPNIFEVNYEITKMETDRASATLRISGIALPKVNTNLVKTQISGKSKAKAENYLKTLDRVYNFNIKRNLSFLNFINPMPFKPDNITIEVITESL